ncbi:MAG: hypothetical protein RLZZ215_1754 [Pseudomonadota bacterium]|jgi:hypothetical protein
MKKIIHGALLAGAIPLVSAQAQAGPLAPIVNEANKLRASAWLLNDQASTLEQTVQSLKRQGINAVELRYKAKVMRRCATKYAIASNRLAKKAFNLGYHRSNHSHPNYNS